MNYPIPKCLLDDIRAIKKETGKTMVRIIADALRYALKKENKNFWL